MPLAVRAVCVFLVLSLATGSAAAQCSVGTSGLNFGAYSHRRAVTSTASITVGCEAGVAFSIELSKGNGDFPQRKMQSAKGGNLSYNLYIRPNYRQIWGDGRTSGTDTMGGVGNGGTQNFTVFSRIPRGQKPEPGHYSDNITVTVRF